MKTLFCILFTFININLIFGQSWEELAPCPKKLDHNTGFRIGDFIYVGLGYDSTYPGNIIDKFYKYDILIDQWSQISSFPGGSRINAASFVLNDKAYVGFGAYPGGICFNDLWEYSPQTDSWLQMASCPNSSCVLYGPSAFSANGKGYIVSSANPSIQVNKVFEYTPQSDTWDQKQNFIGPIRHYASSTSDEVYGYYGMGSNEGLINRDDIWKYDPQIDIWTQLTQNPTMPDFWVGSIIKNNKIYFIGGSAPSQDRVDVYDMIIDNWSTLPNIPYGTHYPLVFSHGCYIYICNGYSLNSNLAGNSNQLFRYKVENDCTLNVIEEIETSTKELIKIFDPMGRETEYKSNTILIYLFSDGTTERVFSIK